MASHGQNSKAGNSNVDDRKTDGGKEPPCSLGLTNSPSTPSTSGTSGSQPRGQRNLPHSVMRSPTSTSEALDSLDYMFDNLSIVVVGASGDLAKKKTFPSLFDLYSHGYIPEHVVILGYARSHKSDEELRAQLKPFLVKHGDADKVDNFLEKIVYRSGEYNDKNAFASLHGELLEFEASQGISNTTNRLFYFAIPPNVFLDTARSIHGTAVSPSGWTRIVVEKPFGHDYDSCERLSEGLGELFTEDHLYRIDHYLGKEMVQNLICLRFANEFLEPLWNRDHVQCVLITFKEDFGTQGRGGYFDKSGIIRDILQNHLTQVLSLVAMEPPVRVSGPGHSDFVRDAKVQLLECIPSVTVDDVVLGQYTGDEKHEGYLDDTTVPNESRTPTFCSAVVRIHNRRWDGVPFILKAGKALDDRKAEIRVQFRQPPAGQYMFDGRPMPPNELVIRLQPKEAIYLKTNVKAPGLRSAPLQSELDLSYHLRYPDTYNPEAYTRLLLDILRGQQSTFVRNDELLASWKIWTPLLHAIEQGKIQPIPYAYGSRGPAEADELAKKVGFVYSGRYTWMSPAAKI
ncbi:glucose-6-phosphate dehydrogenase [Nannochloropsis oceanica]